jgi:hypothetical protein
VIAVSFFWPFGFPENSTIEETLLAAQTGENTWINQARVNKAGMDTVNQAAREALRSERSGRFIRPA